MLDNAKSGFNSATEYMISGLPWVTSSIATGGTTFGYQFDKLSKHIIVANNDSAGKYLRVGFTKNGVEKGNYFRINGGSTVEFDTRVKEIYVRADNNADSPPFSLFAELVNVDSSMMPVLTGSINGVTFWNGIG